MPTYTFVNTETGKSWEQPMSNTDREHLLEQNPHIRQTFDYAPAIVSGVDGLRKPDNTFRDILGRIKRNNRGSTVNTSW
jgi:hypothetical protein